MDSIDRRSFLLGLAAAGGSALLPRVWASEQDVKKVYVVCKCHLDVGFADTQSGILRRYFHDYFPRAIETASALKRAGGLEQYTWTTGSWLLYEYLEQATTDQRKIAESAIHDGLLAWHAIPFTWETEMLDRSLLEATLHMSKSLDKRMGVKTIAAKMTDVPGHSRSIVAPLAHAGVRLLDIGVNPASTPPDVPDFFRWREPGGAEISVMYHRQDYGSVLQIPNTRTAVAVIVRGDNSGPHSIDEIKQIYADLEKQFPGAAILPANLSTVAKEIDQIAHTLPVVTSEIGDTWIYGCASDPVKVARFRELSRLRSEWIHDRKISPWDEVDRAWVPMLALAAEHTWGCDIKSNLGNDGNYLPAKLALARTKPNYKKVEFSWQEKRENLNLAVAKLPPLLRQEAEGRLDKLKPQRPRLEGLEILPVNRAVRTEHFEVTFNSATGAIASLREHKGEREWANAQSQIGTFEYQTFDASDYKKFLSQYVVTDADWAPQDFGKPGIEKFALQHKSWQPEKVTIYSQKESDGLRIVSQLQMPDAGDLSSYVAWPADLFLEFFFPNHSPEIQIKLQWFGKVANRLPEAMWLKFNPITTQPEGWSFEKVDQQVSPLDVVKGGGRSLHAVTRDVTYDAPGRRFILQTLDAPIVAPGLTKLLNFDNALPDLQTGVQVNLFNNTWGTNYVMWIEDDMKFRFKLKFS